MAAMLTPADYAHVIRCAPLVAMDLIICDPKARVLVGLRRNDPAKGTYFVPGGRIHKGERYGDAFARISKEETSRELKIEHARLLGVYDHIYNTNAFNEPGYGTHYVVLGYAISVADVFGLRLDGQHQVYKWMTKSDLLMSGDVHAHTKAYFR